MKNKKGFTLVELLAVIAILAIVISLSLTAYASIRNKTLEKQYNNVESLILTKASYYADDLNTSEDVYVTIDTLIKQGYISADDSSGKIYDPRDNSVMNCFIIKITKSTNGKYEAMVERKDEYNDGFCNEEEVSLSNTSIYCNGSTCQDDWYDKSVTLSINGLSDDILNDENTSITWTNSKGLNVLSDSYLIEDYVVNDTYIATIKTAEKSYQLSKLIKIDTVDPVIDDIVVQYSMNSLMVTASDSGSDNIQYGFGNDCASINYSDSKYYSLSNSEILNVCVKDDAGNLATESVKINKITLNPNYNSNSNSSLELLFIDGVYDFELPTLSESGRRFMGWYNNGRVVTAKNKVNITDGTVLTGEWENLSIGGTTDDDSSDSDTSTDAVTYEDGTVTKINNLTGTMYTSTVDYNNESYPYSCMENLVIDTNYPVVIMANGVERIYTQINLLNAIITQIESTQIVGGKSYTCIDFNKIKSIYKISKITSFSYSYYYASSTGTTTSTS